MTMRTAFGMGMIFAAAAAGRAAEPADPPAVPSGGVSQPEQPEPQMQPMTTQPAGPPAEWPRATGDWFGLRPRLEAAGVTANARFVADYSAVFQGGASPGGSAFRDLFLFNVTLDSEKLLGLNGGTLFADFQNEAGDNGSRDVGDIMGFDSLDADGRTQLAELWYEQTLFDDRLRVRVGKIDPNSTFAVAQFGGDFLHSAPGIPSNVMIPFYPDPAAGIQAVWSPTETFYLGGGVFDGSAFDGVRTGSYGTAHALGRAPTDLSLVGETGVRWGIEPGGLPGRLAVGAWRDTAAFPRFGGGGNVSGTSGYYAILDHTLWRADPKIETDKRGVAAFAQYSYADPRVSLIPHHVGGGIAWTGPLPSRDDDVAGVGAFYVRFADDAGLRGAGELAVELFYKIQLTPFLMIKPDLQYIHNPGGVAGRGDAVIGTVRLQIEF